MDAETIDVLLVDDHQMVLEGLAALISKDPQVRVAGQCGDSMKVMALTEELRPKVIVVDLGMPGLNGLDLCRELTKKFRDVSVLILTMYDDHEFLARALENGAAGYVVKGAPADELLQAIHSVARGQLHLPAGVPKDFLDRLRNPQEDPYNRLTARERQVFQRIAEGLTSRMIAKELSIAVKTVDAHRTRLMRKLGLHNVGGLVTYALRRGGVVPLPRPLNGSSTVPK
jgi:DNA-binding NarL/FixJ family response regulator